MRPPDTPFLSPTLASSTSQQLDTSGRRLRQRATTKEATEVNAVSANVTIRTHGRRDVSPLPSDAHIVHTPNTPRQPTHPRRETPPPHRPAPQIRVVESVTDDASTSAADETDLNTPDVTAVTGTPRGRPRSDAHGKRGGTRKARNALDESPPYHCRDQPQPQETTRDQEAP
ncbi:hypothetical protein B0H13DRAFT_2367083 [Mycena leptocephala]|nr:hypothetical protein B0H13DRAFT_2367083 [Mycena leptocephala]